MSRKLFVPVSVIVMLVLALVVVRFFREPVPEQEAPVVGSVAGNTVTGPLEQAPLSPAAPPLPPASSMIMTSGDGADLPVSDVEPPSGEAPSSVASVTGEVSSGAAVVTEAPRPPVPAAEKTEAENRPGVAGTEGAASVSDPGTPAAPTGAARPAASPAPEAAPAASAKPAPEKAPAATPSAGQPRRNDEEMTRKPGTLVTESSLPARAGSPVITSARLTMDGDVVTLRLSGSQQLKGSAFLLREPDRVVLDLEGSWRVEAPRVPSNRMVKALRVGGQAEATRLVFDMKVKPVKAWVTQVDARTLELRIR